MHFFNEQACEFEGAFERNGFVATDALYFAEVIDGGAGKGVQRTEFFQEFSADLDGGAAFCAGAQKDGEQLFFFQRISPELHEAFARAFTFRQIVDPGPVGHGPRCNAKQACGQIVFALH